MRHEHLEEHLAAMLRLPKVACETRGVKRASANSISLIRFDRNDYSMSIVLAHHELALVGGNEEAWIVSGTEVIVRYRRYSGREKTMYDPRSYLALLKCRTGRLTSPVRSRTGSCQRASRLSAGDSKPTFARPGCTS
jgi:hypothetical protein